jgi:bacterioferritin-associated ferredoxin
MGFEQTVCRCFGVTENDVRAAIENGADTFEAVKAETRVGCGCGCCKESAKQTVEKLLAE